VDLPLVVTAASAASDLPAVLRRSQEQFEAYVQASAEAFSAATRRAIAGDTALFTGFCADLGVSPMPALPAVIVAFIDRCVGRGHKPATIARRISSVSHWHRAHGWRGEHDPTKAETVRLRLRGVRRQLGTRQRQAQGLTEIDVARILGAVGSQPSLRDLRDVGLLLLCRDALLRRSEAAALDVADLETTGDGSGTVLIQRSKVDQEAVGAILYVSPATLAWLNRWLAKAPITSGALFRAFGKGGRLRGRLRAADVPAIFKGLAVRAGLDPTLVSGHSARVGMTQDLTSAGIELPAIMQAGRWASASMPARYGARLMARRGAVAEYHGRRGG
jgi:site-specific recombinase XerD